MSDETQAAPASTHLGGNTAAAPAAAPASAPAAAPAAAAPAAAAPAAAPAPAAAAPAAAPAPSAAPAPAADDKEGKEGKDGKEGKEAGAPEKYEDFKLPEGMQADPTTMGKFAEVAKKHGLTQEAAQEMVNLGAQMQAGNAESIKAAIQAQGEAWGKEALADKEFGGEKFEENLAVAKKGLDQFATPELKNLLVQTKLGNHPEVLRAFFRIGQAISEDGFVPGRVGSARKSNAEVLYGNTTH
jgi:hypothetical protein